MNNPPMDISLENLSKDRIFEVKLQIELYKLAEKVMKEERKENFRKYMEERKEKIRKILGVEHGKIYERGEVIFEI